MSHLSTVPELLTSAAADLARIGSTLGQAHAAAANSTLAVLPAASDEVSVAIAELFSQHGQELQPLAAEAAEFGDMFVQNLQAGAAAYTGAEDLLVWLLRSAEKGLQSLLLASYSLVGEFVLGASAFRDFIPGPLQPFVFAPLLGWFGGAVVGVLAIAYLEQLIALLGG